MFIYFQLALKGQLYYYKSMHHCLALSCPFSKALCRVVLFGFVEVHVNVNGILVLSRHRNSSVLKCVALKTNNSAKEESASQSFSVCVIGFNRSFKLHNSCFLLICKFRYASLRHYL